MLQCQRLALLQPAQEVLLRPVEIWLLVHFRAAFARRHRQRSNVHAIGLGTLQQRHMPQRRRLRLENRHQVAQHGIVGADLAWIAPAVDQARRLVERGVDEMGRAPQLRRRVPALGGIGQIDRNVTGAVELARLAPRQRDHLASTGSAEMPQGSASHQTGGAGHHNLLARHSHVLRCDCPALPSRSGRSAAVRRVMTRCPLNVQFGPRGDQARVLRTCVVRDGRSDALDSWEPIGHPARGSGYSDFDRAQKRGFFRGPGFRYQFSVGRRRQESDNQDRCASSIKRHKNREGSA